MAVGLVAWLVSTTSYGADETLSMRMISIALNGLWGTSQVMRSMTPVSFGIHSYMNKHVFAPLDSYVWDIWESSMPRQAQEPLKVPVVTLEQLRKGFEVDLSKPLIVPGLLNHSSKAGSKAFDEILMDPPYSDLTIDYFTDARKFNLVPDGRACLKDIARNISQNRAYAKIGSEMVFRTYPELLDFLPVKDLERICGRGYIDKSLIGNLLTMPIFMSHGHLGQSTRTDLHCEPIANVVLQVRGSKRWILALPDQSKYLRPRISPDGRAYVYSSRSPSDKGIERIQRYSVVTNEGDTMFIPTWTWHRVDYLPGVTALSVSFFHVRPRGLVNRNPTYFLSTLPNMLKELFGIKKQ